MYKYMSDPVLLWTVFMFQFSSFYSLSLSPISLHLMLHQWLILFWLRVKKLYTFAGTLQRYWMQSNSWQSSRSCACSTNCDVWNIYFRQFNTPPYSQLSLIVKHCGWIIHYIWDVYIFTYNNLCLILKILCSTVINIILYSSDSAVKVHYPVSLESSRQLGKYILKSWTKSFMVSYGQCKDYRSQIFSNKPQY